jgi:DNA-directed RNA polymerase specialized sigma subunit|tara:strand:+ start:1968 stop:2309 length:342 start_codon:yes stop_codon:yes gene_type:complete
MKNHYINNEDFESIILSYQKEPEIYEDELVSLFDLLITNIIESFRFKVDPDDAKQECFALVLKTVKNFKPRKGTAFNYFTTIVVNNLKLMYTREKKYNIKIENYIEKRKDDFI